MKKYKVTFGRTVVVSRIYEAESEGHAQNLALSDEFDNPLHPFNITVITKEGTEVENISDDENVFEVELIEE